MDIRVTGTANLQQMRSQFKTIQKDVAELNATLAETSIIPGRVNPAGYQQMQRQVAKTSDIWRSAAASTDLFTTQQLRLNSATEKYTDLLKRQKLSWNDLRRNRNVMRQAYKEQIALQNMIVRQNPGLTSGGKTAYDVAIPKNVHSDLNTIGNQLGWISAETASASRMMVNWGKNTQWAGRQLMVGFTMPVAAFGAATGALAYNVDKQLTRVQKVYDTTAQVVAGDAESMKRVNQELDQVAQASLNTARNAAQQYGAAATDTLNVQADLAATGLRGAKLQKATTEAMRLATLGELDYGQAAETTIALQTAFRLNTEQLTKAFNFMNATENATSLTIQDIAEATPRAASAMSALGVSVEQMTVMLASMKESGVDAAEAANALKSATGTMLAPSPAAQAFIDQITGGRIQIAKIAEEADGNLYVALQHLSQEMDGLSKFEKQQILVKLFGKYQFNRVSAMLYNMEDAFNGVQNQTHKAMELMGKDSETLANTAETEMKRYQDSISGQFKRALETTKLSLAEMGEPFLNVATQVLKYVAALADKFNSLPDSAKNIAAIGAILTALVGPTIMMIGLAANFAGNIGLMIARIVGLGSQLKILNKEEWATEKVSQLATLGFVKTGTQVELLTQQVNALVQSFHAAKDAVEGLNNTPARGITGSLLPGGINNRNGVGPVLETNVAGLAGAKYGPTTLLNTPQYRLPEAPSTSAVMNAAKAPTVFGPMTYEQTIAKSLPARRQSGKLVSDELRVRQATQAVENNISKRLLEQEVVRTRLVRDAQFEGSIADKNRLKEEALNKAKERGASLVSGAAVATAAMGASMLLMTTNSNETANNIGKWLMLGTIGVPAAKAMGEMTKAVAVRAADAAKGAFNTAKGMRDAATTTNKVAGAARLAGAGIKGMGAGLMAVLGTGGAIALALGTVGFLAYKWWEREKKITAEKEAQAKAMYDQNNLLQEQLRIRARDQQTINTVSSSDGKVTAGDLADQMKDSDAYKPLIDSMKSGEEIDKNATVMKKYVDILNSVGGSAKKAQKYVEALYIASGTGALEAERLAQGVRDTMGDIVSGAEQGELWANQLLATINDTEKSADDAGVEMGKSLADSIARGGNENADAILGSFQNSIETSWDQMFETVNANAKEQLNNLGVTTGEQFKQIVEGYQQLASGAMSEGDFIKLTGMDAGGAAQVMQVAASYVDGFNEKTTALFASEKAISNELAGQLGISRDINTLAELRNTWEWKLQTANQGNAQALYDQQVANLENLQTTKGIFGGAMAVTDAQKLQILNQIRLAMGLQETNNLADGFSGKLSSAADEAKKVKDELSGIPKYLNVAFNFTGEEYKSAYKSGMEGVTNDLADLAEERFDNRMNNAIDSAEEAQNKALDRLDNQQQAAMDRFENRWDARRKAVEKSYDARIANIDKEIKAEEKADKIREKIFQNEMDRITRLSEAANRNIDFNVALDSGNFDEAARIRNDAEAANMNNALQDALDRQSGRSDARTERLNNQKDNLDKERQRILDSLDKREEDERKHLEKIQKMRRDALQEQTDAEIEAMRDRWQEDKDTLDDRLTLFKSYTGRNQKDLERWMKVVGLSYDDFGIDVKHKGDAWSKYFRHSLAENVRMAGSQIASDKMWEHMGKDVAKQMLGGALDMSWGQFKHWMTTGEFKTGGYKPPKKGEGGPHYPAYSTGTNKFEGDGLGLATRHTGGEINSSLGSRKGVARTQKGLHASERLVLAQDGEYMVNRGAAAKHRPILDAINSGKFSNGLMRSRRNVGDGVGGGVPGIAGVMAAIIGTTIRAGISRGLSDQISRKQAETAMFSGVFSAGEPGMYSDRAFSAQQLKNAALIASVGSGMGMSARDIMIGIMTAITESGLINVNYGDRDSLGLFQQRPSMGWGTPEQVTDPEYAARTFFNHLKGISGRDNLSPWAAAQAVQRSGTADGSNYQQYWDNANAIFKNGLIRSADGKYTVVSGTGTGGMHKPSVPGKGWGNSHDYHNGPKSPLYAYNDGTVIESRAITSGGSAGNGLWPTPYRSYGETIVIRGKDGHTVRYAHLYPDKRFVKVGDPVKGGQLIGLSGNTGNAWGAGGGYHTHFEVDGSEAAREWFAGNGIGLKTGGYTKNDGIANLHKNEVVVDPNRTKDLFNNMDKLTALINSGWTYDPILTLFDKFTNKAFSGNGKGAPASQVAGDGNLQSGTYNVAFHSKNVRTENDLSRLMGLADILSLQEVSGNKRRLGDWLNKRGWGWAQSHPGPALTWNKKALDVQKTGSVELSQHGPGAHDYAEYGKFKSKKGGGSFWQISAHTVAWPQRGGPRRAQQLEQYATLHNLWSRLHSDGTPVIVSGDLNTDIKRGDYIKRIGLGPGTHSGKFTHGNSWLDHILYKGLRQTGQDVISGLSSDHNALISNFQIPQFKEGGFIMSGGLARLHDDEMVASKPITADIVKGAKNFANGGNSEYNVQVNLNGTDLTVDQVTNAVFKAIKRTEDRKPGSRKE